MTTPKIDSRLLAKARKLTAKGLSVSDAATALGVGKSQLYAKLNEAKRGAVPRTRAAPVAPPPALDEGPIPAAADDDLVILDEALKEARAALAEASLEKNYGKVKTLVETVLMAVKMRRLMAPPVLPSVEELEAKARPRADDVLAKVRAGVAAVARGEAKAGRCCRCSTQLTPEQVEQRRAEGGAEDGAPVAPPAEP